MDRCDEVADHAGISVTRFKRDQLRFVVQASVGSPCSAGA
jgi:hypothetical protein